MATYYVWNGASGAADGSSKADAYTTLAAGLSAATVLGDIILVHDTHTETASSDFTFSVHTNHTRQQPLQIICVDMDTSDTPVSNYGTSGNGEIDAGTTTYHIIFTGGSSYHWGMRYLFSDASSPHLREDTTFENCLYRQSKTSSESLSLETAAFIRFINCDVEFVGTGKCAFTSLAANDGGSLLMIGGSFSNAEATSSSRLVKSAGGSNGQFIFNGVDMTGFSTTGSVLELTGGVESMRFRLINCVFPGTEPTIVNGSLLNLRSGSDVVVTLDDTYRRFHASFVGSSTDETTIRRAGGASDGTTDFSIKVESNSNAKESYPYRTLLACQNYGNLSGKTLKIHFAQNGGSPTAIKDTDIWLEIHSAADFTTTRALPLASGTNHTDESSSEDWRDGGGALTGYTEQSISASGFGTTSDMVYVWLCVAADFTTTNNLYVCPKIEIA